MTPTEMATLARQQYNAVNDTFFSEDEINSYIYWAQMDLARFAFAIRDTFTTTTVVDQQEYTLPTNTTSVKRVTYNGDKLTPIDFRDDDDLILLNQTSVSSATPGFYYTWGNSIFLRPIPDDTVTLKVWTFKRPQAVTTTSTLEVPEEYHLDMVDFLVYRMAIKDINKTVISEMRARWQLHLSEARKLERRKLRSDSAAFVKDVERLAITRFGTL